MTVPPPQSPEPVVWVLMLIAGIILLLPGLCSLAFMISDISLARDELVITLWLVSLVISTLGILLIRAAWRRRRR
jgi:hypothetical protein